LLKCYIRSFKKNLNFIKYNTLAINRVRLFFISISIFTNNKEGQARSRFVLFYALIAIKHSLQLALTFILYFKALLAKESFILK